MISRRCLLVFLFLLSIVSCAQGRSADADWRKVQKLKRDTPIIIKLRSGEWLRANLVNADDTQLRLEQQVQPDDQGLLTRREVQRSDVQLIYRVSPPLSQSTRKFIGGLVGLGVALAVGAIADSQAKSHEDDGLVGFSVALIAVPGGIAIGGNTPGREKHKLIYEAP
jgi:hypothetical protein